MHICGMDANSITELQCKLQLNSQFRTEPVSKFGQGTTVSEAIIPYHVAHHQTPECKLHKLQGAHYTLQGLSKFFDVRINFKP